MKKLMLSDYKVIKKYLDDAHYEGYNSNFTNMMLWDHEYNIYYYHNDSFLVMLHTYGSDRFFSMPFCKKEYLKEAIDYMIDYAKKNHFPFKINLAIESIKKNIHELYPDRFLYLEDRNNFDYVYTCESLMYLKGKKMQKRRNHLNAFYKTNTDYIYKEIEDQAIDNVLKFLEQWDSQKEGDTVRSEYLAIMYALIHRKTLNIKTGCIYINNQLEAFIIGSQLYHQTVEIHFEKANKNIRGLYVLICKLFLENNYPEQQYVNREEDMGIPELRKAKLSLHPDHMVKKYTIVEKNLQIRKAKPDDLPIIKKQWLDNFEDENELSTEYYFQNLYHQDNDYIISNNEEMIGNMQIRPFEISYNKKKETVFFILGVVIDEKYRHNGCMNYLLNHVIKNDYPNKKMMLQAYIPSIYHKLGFQNMYMNHLYVVDKKIEHNQINEISESYCQDVAILLQLYNQFTESFDGFYIRNEDYYRYYVLKRNKILHRKIRLISNHENPIGYIEYETSEKKMIITEFIFVDASYVYDVLNYFLELYEKIEFSLPKSFNLSIQPVSTYCNMLTNFIPVNKENLFINEIY